MAGGRHRKPSMKDKREFSAYLIAWAINGHRSLEWSRMRLPTRGWPVIFQRKYLR